MRLRCSEKHPDAQRSFAMPHCAERQRVLLCKMLLRIHAPHSSCVIALRLLIEMQFLHSKNKLRIQARYAYFGRYSYANRAARNPPHPVYQFAALMQLRI